DRLAIDGIVRPRRNIRSVRDDCRVGLDGAASAVEPAEPLPQGVDRGSLSDERVEIDIHADLDTLGRNEDERPFELTRFASADWLQRFNKTVPVYRPCRSDHQDGLRNWLFCSTAPR